MPYISGLGVESFFRKLKYMIGLSNFHSYKPQYIEQEIWAKLITYNIMETVINYIVLETNDTKHAYKVNFTIAAHICICRVFFCLNMEKDKYDVMSLLPKKLIPVWMIFSTQDFKQPISGKPRYFICKAA